MSLLLEDIPSKEEIEKLFSKYYSKEYVPKGQTGNYPKYTPAPSNIGPRPITIEEYRKRNQKKEIPKQENKKKRKRGGKKQRLRKKRQELLRLIGLSKGEQKRQLYKQLRRLNGKSEI